MSKIMMCLLSILFAGCEYVPPTLPDPPSQIIDVFNPVTLYFQILDRGDGGKWAVAIRTEPNKYCPDNIACFQEYESDTGCFMVKLETTDDRNVIKHYHSFRCQNPNCLFKSQNTNVER